MYSQPFRKLGRSVLAASAVSLGVASLGAQTTPAPMPAVHNPSRADVFMGFSYWSGKGKLNPPGLQYSSVDVGAIGSGAYYFNKYVGMEVSAAFHPDGVNDGLMPLLQAGPIFRLPTQDVTFFAHGMAGAARLGGPNNNNPASFEHEPYMWGPALTAGGGMDYDLPFFNHKFALRLFQADYTYIHEDYGPYVGIPTGGVLGGRANVSSAQLSTGLLLHLGSIVPPPPVTYSCVASPTSGYAGDPITVTGTAMNVNPKKTATYAWTSDGGKISGTTNVATVDTTGANPGTYNVKGTVTESMKPGRFADCTVPFTINPLPALSLSCSASPSTVQPGGSSTITSTVSDSYGRPVNYTYSYSASSGSVSGSSATTTLSTTGAAPGTITVTCNVADDKGRNATATTTVSVEAPPAPPAPTTSALCSITFDRDKRRPARVDNEAKACLDDIALNLQRNSDAKLAIVADSTMGKGRRAEEMKNHLASERAVNTKEYLVTEKGIDASRIMVYTGTGDDNTVSTTLIPAGATAPSMGTAVDEGTVKAVPRNGAPRHGHRRK
jgi:outer membrane protein OmpA-like peptidoglycan-associated protein